MSIVACFTDFGWNGPYVGQLHMVVARRAPRVRVIDLMHDAPVFAPQPAGHLLAALVPQLSSSAVVLAVVDPGVGSERAAVAMRADGRWYVGPDNGLFDPIVRRASTTAAWQLTWRPPVLSPTFHGRDLFAPIAADLALGNPVPGDPIDPAVLTRPDAPETLSEVIYIDAYGNSMTGMPGQTLSSGAKLTVAGHTLDHAKTFADRPCGTGFWYANSIGLVEIAVSHGSAATAFGLAVGTPVAIVPPAL